MGWDTHIPHLLICAYRSGIYIQFRRLLLLLPSTLPSLPSLPTAYPLPPSLPSSQLSFHFLPSSPSSSSPPASNTSPRKLAQISKPCVSILSHIDLMWVSPMWLQYAILVLSWPSWYLFEWEILVAPVGPLDFTVETSWRFSGAPNVLTLCHIGAILSNSVFA